MPITKFVLSLNLSQFQYIHVGVIVSNVSSLEKPPRNLLMFVKTLALNSCPVALWLWILSKKHLTFLSSYFPYLELRTMPELFP
jgi:hypothetical protein